MHDYKHNRIKVLFYILPYQQRKKVIRYRSTSNLRIHVLQSEEDETLQNTFAAPSSMTAISIVYFSTSMPAEAKQ